MSEPPDRPGEVEVDPRYAFSASAVLEKRVTPISMSSQPGATSDVLSGIGSSTSRTTSPSVSPERPSLEDALSLDDDSEISEGHDDIAKHLDAVEQLQNPALLLQQRGFLLPRSPARLFVHNAVVQSALSSVASSSAPVTLSDVVEQQVIADQTHQQVLDQIEQDLQNQLDVLERIESDLEDEQQQSSVRHVELPPVSSQDVVVEEQPIQSSTVLEQMEHDIVVPCEPAEQVVEEDKVHHYVSSHPAAAIDSGVCELMFQRESDGQHTTDQYSDAYITAVDSMSSSDFGDTPEPPGNNFKMFFSVNFFF